MTKKIKFFKTPFLLFVLIGGVFFGILLINEYRSNVKLIEGNQNLLLSSARKTLSINIENIIRKYPDDPKTLLKQWKNYSADTYWLKNGKQLFPFLHKNSSKDHFDSTWNHYNTQTTETIQNEESKERINLIRRISTAQRLKDKSLLRKEVNAFLYHKENYQLFAIEEIVSWLALLETSQENNWSRQLVKNTLIDDWPARGRNINGIAEILLAENSSLSIKDVKQIFNKILYFSEIYNISIEPLPSYIENLYRRFELKALPEEGLWLKDYSWLVIPKKNNQHLILPINLDNEISSVESQLKSQGLLNNEDHLSFSPEDRWINLEQLSITISKSSWKKALEQQRYYLSLKLVMLLSLLALILLAYRSLKLKIKKKQNLLSMQEDFIHLVSHELKTPLASIQLMAETLQKRLSNQLSPRDYPLRILNESDRLQIMIDNILSLNRVKFGMDDLATESVKLNEIVTSAASDFQTAFSDKLQLQIDIPDSLEARLNPILFSLVVRNLLSNAIKYNNNNVVIVKINFNHTAKCLMIEDNGTGIEKNDWERVFTEFYRNKGDHSKPGLGLGLPLSRAIMRSFSGDLFISQSNQNGTQWQLSLKTYEN